MRLFSTWLEAKEIKLSTKDKKEINNFLYAISKNYWDTIPIKDISEMLSRYNIEMEQFLLTGRDGRDMIELTQNGQPINSALILSWHKMDSGRWEITAYLS